MKETEITLQVFCSLEETKNILFQQGYKVIRDVIMDDHYFTSLTSINNTSYSQIIKSSILLRAFIGNENKNILIYKNKEFDDKGNVICEEKVNCPVSDIYSAEKILKLANFNNFVNINTHIIVFKKDIEFALQDVKNLGLFLEIEEFDYMQNMSPEQKAHELVKVANSLNLKLGTDYNCKKVQMMLDKQNKNN